VLSGTVSLALSLLALQGKPSGGRILAAASVSARW